jgi:two-component system phosphate regulon response regulator OmpR
MTQKNHIKDVPLRQGDGIPCPTRGREEPILEADHILIVDDDRDIGEMLRDYLEERGYRVALAHDAAAARSFLDDRQFDLLVADHRLAGETSEDLAVYATSRGISCLLMSGNSELRTVRQLTLPFMAKPFRLKEFEQRVEDVLVSSRRAAQSA